MDLKIVKYVCHEVRKWDGFTNPQNETVPGGEAVDVYVRHSVKTGTGKVEKMSTKGAEFVADVVASLGGIKDGDQVMVEGEATKYGFRVEGISLHKVGAAVGNGAPK